MSTESWRNDPRVGSAGLVGQAQIAGGAFGYAVPSGLPGLVDPHQPTGECSPETLSGLVNPGQPQKGLVEPEALVRGQCAPSMRFALANETSVNIRATSPGSA